MTWHVRMRDLDWRLSCPIARCLVVTWSLFLRRCWLCIGLLACRKTHFTGGNSDSRPIVTYITKIDIFYCMNVHKRRLSTIGRVCERGWNLGKFTPVLTNVQRLMLLKSISIMLETSNLDKTTVFIKKNVRFTRKRIKVEVAIFSPFHLW